AAGESMSSHERFDRLALIPGHVRDDQVLVRRETEIAVVHLGDGTQAGEPLGATGHIPQAAVLDEKSQVRPPVVVLGPAVAITRRREGEWLGRAELDCAA